MTDREQAERWARQARYAETIRAAERKRAWDIIEMATLDQPDDVATALWRVAQDIVAHREV